MHTCQKEVGGGGMNTCQKEVGGGLDAYLSEGASAAMVRAPVSRLREKRGWDCSHVKCEPRAPEPEGCIRPSPIPPEN